MATAKKLPSGNYRVRVHVGNGKYKSFTAERKADAEYAANLYLQTCKDKSSPTKITVGEAIDQYIESKSNILSPSTIREYRRMRKQYLKTIIDKPVFKLSNQEVQAAINIEAQTHAYKTVRNIFGLLSAALKGKVDLDVALPQKEKIKITIPTQQEIRRLLQYAAGKEIELPILLSACLGLRRGEIAPLDYSDIDFQRKTITISKSMVLNSSSEWVVKKPKTYSGNRTLKVYDFILDKVQERKDAELPLISLTPNQISDEFSYALEKTGLPHFRFHDLRHYNASVMLSLNIPDKYAMERMGHATNNMLKTVYQHTMQEKEDSVDAALSEYFNALSISKE